jgi:hypothetical protein
MVHLSLLLALVVTYARAVYRYTAPREDLEDSTAPHLAILFVIGIVLTALVAYALTPFAKSGAVKYALFFMIVYSISTTIEWVGHKYVMHCYMHWPQLLHTKTDNFILKRMKHSCNGHANHHLEVKPDMNMSHVNDIGNLVFDWSDLISIFIPVICVTLLVTWALKLEIPWIVQVIVTLFLAAMYGYFWNNAHPRMHNIHVDMPISEGPPIVGRMSYPNIYYKNHEAHHLVKGADKGNYNVVFLGADEFFKSNNMGG